MASVLSFDVHYWNIRANASGTIDGDQKVFLSKST